MEGLKTERWEPLSDSVAVLVNERGKLTSDTLLLAHFSLPQNGECCAELCSGTGGISFYWYAYGKPKSVAAYEIDPELCGLARRSSLENGSEQTVCIHCADIRTLVPDPKFDLIACNPPYYEEKRSQSGKHDDARRELSCALSDAVCAASGLLREGGSFFLCHRPERREDILKEFSKFGLAPKRLQYVQDDSEKRPFLLLLEGVKNGKEPLMTELPLCLNKNGKPTQEAVRIYGSFRKHPRYGGKTDV